MRRGRCKRAFEYHPKDYHRHVSCGHVKCGGTFGFWLHHVPPRVEDELRREAKQEQERRAKQREASAARVARAARKGGGATTDAAKQRQALRAVAHLRLTSSLFPSLFSA